MTEEIESLQVGTVRTEVLNLSIVPESETEAALNRINERHSQRVLTPDDVFILPTIMSDMTTDSYFTRMADSSLRNYRVDAEAGIPLMNSHRTGGGFFIPEPAELPMGRSFSSSLAPDPNTVGNQSLYVSYYMLRGLTMNGVRTDDLILGLTGGVIRSTSIGFSMRGPNAWYRCSVCGKDMMRDEECRHVPGLTYGELDELATAWVENARLKEGSLVWAGANPSAGVVKATRGIEEGWLDRSQVRAFEEQYEVRLLGTRVFVKPEMQSGDNEEVDGMNLEEVRALFPDVQGDTVEAILTAVSEDRGGGAAALAEVRELTERLENAETRMNEVQKQIDRIPDLESRAAEGDAYRTALIDEAVTARVRVQGSDFDAEAYRRALTSMSLDYVRSETVSWEATMKQIAKPGRQVKPDGRKADAALSAPAEQYRG